MTQLLNNKRLSLSSVGIRAIACVMLALWLVQLCGCVGAMCLTYGGIDMTRDGQTEQRQSLEQSASFDVSAVVNDDMDGSASSAAQEDDLLSKLAAHMKPVTGALSALFLTVFVWAIGLRPLRELPYSKAWLRLALPGIPLYQLIANSIVTNGPPRKHP